jgi:hypothetical protein
MGRKFLGFKKWFLFFLFLGAGWSIKCKAGGAKKELFCCLIFY